MRQAARLNTSGEPRRAIKRLRWPSLRSGFFNRPGAKSIATEQSETRIVSLFAGKEERYEADAVAVRWKLPNPALSCDSEPVYVRLRRGVGEFERHRIGIQIYRKAVGMRYREWL